ncbi:MAG: RNA polymerase-associated protein RapA [Verrucomicrobia subdivision 3 bacterium]|nr:RNA polymerase-associated protein RapA [Limisphaerales bacterium]MCS1414940.1 RNA polymerase-associated protein RapA [Limisphaerales bacterium]
MGRLWKMKKNEADDWVRAKAMNSTPSKQQTGIWDNHSRGIIGDFLRHRIKPGAELSFVSAYFTIYAYAALKDELDQISRFRFLFGEPRFIQSLNPEKTEKKAFAIEKGALTLASKLTQKHIARECAQWIKAKTDIRSVVRTGFLHGKMYHVNNNGVSEAIIGSSNFTVSGLGLGPHGNIELNLQVNDNRDRDDLKAWFDEVWKDNSLVKDVKPEVLRSLAQMYQNHSPQFIYLKTLFHIFQDYLSKAELGGLLDEKTGFFESDVWNLLYDFQKDGVKGAINKILTHKGCVIADSVGLGKTFEALAVIKYFELLNARVLVLCPKKLESNWLIYRNNDKRNPLLKDRFAYTVQAHTDLGLDKHATHHWGNYNLVVIDESHNFRNNAPGKQYDDGTRRLSRYEFLMRKVLQDGVDTNVLLLSATPVNTNLKDLRNQIYLLTQDNDRAFETSLSVHSIGQTMKNAQTCFTRWANPKKNPERKVSGLLDILDSAFFKLLDELTIARSRRHVKRYYDIAKVGRFPERLKPLTCTPGIDIKGSFPAYDDLNEDISRYKLCVYNPSEYILPKFISEYPKATEDASALQNQKDRENYLIGMMRVNFLKRLESSIKAFKITLDRTIKKIEDLEDKIIHFDKNRAKYMNPELFDDADDEEEMADLKERFMVGKKLEFRLEHLDINRWLGDLKADKTQLISIHKTASKVTPDRDAKLHKLKNLIAKKQECPVNPKNEKVLVFTAFSDTALYLYECLRPWLRDKLGLHVAVVTGSGDNKTTFKPQGFRAQTDFNAILTNFSPRSKHREKMVDSMPQEGEIDILIASDCISEGQNLQDCDYLVNYDIHWNPVRIIQRFGRIDRLGSTNRCIQLVNFWPTQDLNKYINLKDRVEARMVLADLAATVEDDLLNPEQSEDLHKNEQTYREKQLLRLKDEVLDLEDIEENVSLSEFTLDDFREELMNHLEANRAKLNDAPLGLCALVPPLKERRTADPFDSSLRDIARPGVIFCLRHSVRPTENRRSVNPINPYYLVYVRSDGEIRSNFMYPKQILSIYRALCQGQTEPFKDLCEAFDQETDNSRKMHEYTRLLNRAIDAIKHGFKKRAVQSMLGDRNAVIPKTSEQPISEEDFELITWLVIKESGRG